MTSRPSEGQFPSLWEWSPAPWLGVWISSYCTQRKLTETLVEFSWPHLVEMLHVSTRLCACNCVCVIICTYACVRLHVCACDCMHVELWVCQYACGCVHTQVGLHARVCACICTHVCAHVGICVRTWVHGGPRASVPTNIYHVGGDGFL